MSVNTIVYAHDKKGKLAAYRMNEVVSFEGAIEAVKGDLGVNRALCLVINPPIAASVPTPEEEAA